MGVNVFGTPVTTSYLERMEEYSPWEAIITHHDRAKVAMEQKNADGKDMSARNTMKQLRDELKVNDFKLFTICLVYNATGNSVRFYDARQWYGSLCESHYPMVIANGQWGACLQRSSSGFIYGYETAGGFIYEGNNLQGKPVHWVTAFQTSYDSKSKILTEIRPPIHDSYVLSWETLKDEVSGDGCGNHCYLEHKEGSAMYGCIGDGDTAMLEVVLTLPGVIDS